MTESDVHLTQLAGWVLHTLGKAFVIASIIAAIAGGIAASSDVSIGLPLIVGPVVFGLVLWYTDPPLPIQLDDED